MNIQRLFADETRKPEVSEDQNSEPKMATEEAKVGENVHPQQVDKEEIEDMNEP